MTRFKTIDQGTYWEIHDWDRGFCVATAIPDQDMAEAMAESLEGSITADRDRWKALAVEAGAKLESLEYITDTNGYSGEILKKIQEAGE